MTGAYKFLKEFSGRIVRLIQLHLSELDTLNRHDVISQSAALAFSQVRQFVVCSEVLILGSRVNESDIDREAETASFIFETNRTRETASHFSAPSRPLFSGCGVGSVGK